MNFNDFRDVIISLLKSRLPSDVTITPKQIIKNNGSKKEALIITRKGEPTAPAIYIDSPYCACKHGKTPEEIAEEIANAYLSVRLPAICENDSLTHFEKVRSRIIYRLINSKKNPDLLKDVPHYSYLDLSIIFCCVVSENDDSMSSFIIHDEHMKSWDTDRAELFSLAKENTPRLLPLHVCPITEMIKELMPETAEFGELVDATLEGPTFYVLTNNKKLNGASSILYDNALLDLANKLGSDLYVIPSSVHETLLLPKDDDSSGEYLNSIIADGNRTLIDPEDYLSDHYYLFCRKQNALSCG